LIKLPRIQALSIALLIAIGCLSSAAAQDWPTRTITLVVPFGPGSGSDFVARIIAARLSEVLGQTVIVQNDGGAGGIIGVSRVAKASPDGYEFVLGAVDTFAQSQSLRKNPPYNSAKDFTPVGLAVSQPLLLIVRKDLPVTNLKEFATYVRTNQNKMQYGSAGVGASPHLACFQLTATIGAVVTHVPYRGSAPAIQDLLAGNLDYYCPLAVAAIPLIKSGSVKALAILTSERSPILPNLPTAKEQGLDIIDNYYWMGFFLPKGTPEPIVIKLNAAINTALDTPSVQARLRELATTVVPADHRSPGYMRSYLDSEIANWSRIIKASGITPD
jgi:tripartite-type tricarboxylate transporter receptor subunit TctC